MQTNSRQDLIDPNSEGKINALLCRLYTMVAENRETFTTFMSKELYSSLSPKKVLHEFNRLFAEFALVDMFVVYHYVYSYLLSVSKIEKLDNADSNSEDQ